MSKDSKPVLSPSVPIETSRVMLPDDTNPMGNVHGGTILKLIEQAGHIVATRHCNKNRAGPPLTAVLARVEHMDFHNPMFVGEVAQVHAAVSYTSERSMEVTVDVWAEDTLGGTRRHTNSARLWYVAISASVGPYEHNFKPVSVPPLSGLSEGEMEAGRQRYETQKRIRSLPVDLVPQASEHRGTISSEQGTVASSRTTLTNLVLPSDCMLTGHMTGGALMKIMDTAAGIASVRHCRTPAVTVCLDAINFHQPIFNGDVVYVTAEIVFTSAKSMVVEVRVEAEGLRSGARRVTNDAFFTFVSIGKGGKSERVPPLKLKTDEEVEKFERFKKDYEAKKKERLASEQKQ